MIYINQVLQSINDSKRIRIIDIDEPYVYIVNIDANTSMPQKELYSSILTDIEHKRLIIINDPFLRLIEDEDLSEIQKEKREENWLIIQKYCLPRIDLLLKKEGRETKINEISNELGVTSTKIKKTLSRYWQRGMNKNALLPDYINSGGRGKTKNLSENKVGRRRNVTVKGDFREGISITTEIKVQFEIAIDKYYRKTNNYSLKDVYHFILRDFYSDRIKVNDEIEYRIWDVDRIPSYDQFYYWFKKWENPKKDIEFRKSTKEFDLKYRPLISNSVSETIGPGTRFQIDATIADVYLLSSLNPNLVIGRPIIYAIIDVYSRMVTGIYIGLEGPSWLGAMMALDNMITDKVEFCKQYGIDITEEQWPTNHLPEIIIADRGEFEGYNVSNLINNLNIKIENTSAYRGDLKGIVERKFRTINEKIKKQTPGAIQKEFRQRGDEDYRLGATLNLKQFTSYIITLILEHNHKIIDKYPMEKEMITDGLTPKPINLWNWGIKNRKGRLRTIDRSILRLNVLPKGKATVTRSGIKFKNLLYGSQKAIEEQWYLKLKNKSIVIVYDPRYLENIYIPSDNGMDFEVCILLEPSQQYKEDFLEDILFQQEYLNELKEQEKAEQIQLKIDTDLMLERIIKEAKENKKSIIKKTSKREKIASIRDNRAAEKQLNREEEKFNLLETEIEKSADVIEFQTSKTQDIVIPKKSSTSPMMEMLKRKRDEKLGRNK